MPYSVTMGDARQNDKNNSGKKCLVLGGSGTIGSAICSSLAREGADVAFTFFQNPERAQVTAEVLSKCYMLSCDVRDEKQIHKTVCDAHEKLGGLDAVVYSIGLSGDEDIYARIAADQHGTIKNITTDEVCELMRVNATGAFNLCQAALPLMKNSGGNIVIIGSMVCSKAVASPVHFSMSKTALNGLVESFAKDAGTYNICVNMLAPGLLSTGASRSVHQSLKDTYLKHCALKRYAEPAEIAEFAAWMALENTYVTGQCILLDGGL